MCIIQDSKEDKDALIRQMHEIFACAQVTIAASKASRCTEGFLAPRFNAPKVYVTIQDHIETHNVGPSRVVLMPSSKRHVEPLVTRTWTLQETLLSRRVLSYGSWQLHWYCGVRKRFGGRVSYSDASNRASFQTLEERHFETPRTSSSILRWIEIVQQYAMREMSEPSDKLIAISAVAQRFVSLTEGRWGLYYAGIWRERFFEQLLWATSKGQIAKRPVQYRAPSWSWAAIDGRLDWPSTGELINAEILCTLLDVGIQPLRSKQPYGAVTTRRIKVHGEFKRVLWSADRKTVKDNENQAAVTRGFMQTYPDVREHDAHDMTVHVLKVAMCYSRRFGIRCGLNKLERHVEGILLEHIGNEVYQRVGVMGLRSIEEGKISSPGWWEQSFLESRQWWSEGFASKEIYII